MSLSGRDGPPLLLRVLRVAARVDIVVAISEAWERENLSSRKFKYFRKHRVRAPLAGPGLDPRIPLPFFLSELQLATHLRYSQSHHILVLKCWRDIKTRCNQVSMEPGTYWCQSKLFPLRIFRIETKNPSLISWHPFGNRVDPHTPLRFKSCISK